MGKMSKAFENHVKSLFENDKVKNCDCICKTTCREHKLCVKKKPDLYYAKPGFDPNNIQKILVYDDGV